MRSLRKFRVKLYRRNASAADEHDGSNGVVAFHLIKGGTETVHTGIAVDEERAAVIRDGVPVGVGEDPGAWASRREVPAQ